jgi:hypothetical protein
MRKFAAILATLALALAVSGQALSQSDAGAEDLSQPDSNAPPMLGIHWARGFEPSSQTNEADLKAVPKPSPLLIDHGGIIMPNVVTENIFWGASWGTYKGDKITGLDTFYSGIGGSDYAETSDEYTGSNGQVSPVIDHLGHVIDTSPATSDRGAIPDEVCHAIPNPDPDGNGYYPVYTDIRRGKAPYCSYHSFGQCGGIRVQFAFFFKLDKDAGCNPQDQSRMHSEGLAALANVSGHELSEARTDPTGLAWHDNDGQENADKCAWTFHVPLVTFSDGSRWKIQGNWSNAAYDVGTGYPNKQHQRGCLDGR